MTRIFINEVEFNNGSKIEFDKNDIIVFVGPNNAGKSASLKEMASLITSKNSKHKIISSVNIEREGSEKELFEYLKTVSKESKSGSQIDYKGFGFNVSDMIAKQSWTDHQNGLRNLAAVFVKSLSTEGRLNAVQPARNIKLTTDSYSHPIHFLQGNDILEKKFSDYFRQAFNADLIVHRNAGDEVPLYVGNRPKLKVGEDRVSLSYIKEIEKLELLHDQGDGMRSFVGVLLNAFISSHSILFIDEPEAFLHPPQARLLGKMLGKDLPSERQLFLATHSEDFLKGLLDADINNLKIIRIQRNGSKNNFSMLNSSDIESIWNDSLLRHSNVLNGLFHSEVIICESDSDCRFFSSIISAIYDRKSIVPDILFIHCGGKHRMPIVIKALKKLNVPLKVVTDFDVLNDINPLKDIYTNLNGDWNNVEKDWKMVKNEIEQKRPEFLTSDLKLEIDNIFADTVEKHFPKDKVKRIQSALKKSSAWSEAKTIGKVYIPNGDATIAFERIQDKFKKKGLFILENGELESFVKSVGNHGPKWVSEVLTKNLKTDKELEVARQFVVELIS